MTNRTAIIGLLCLQVVSAVFFFVNILSTVTGFAQFSWMVHELIELGAGLGLLLGIGFGSLLLRRTLKRQRQMEDQLRVASGAFHDLMQERFLQWRLTPAETDVALFAIKGLSTAEIAAVRDTSEGTVKAQTNAIYRKANVSGRPQLLSLFIEDLMSGPLPSTPAAQVLSAE